MNVGSTIQFIAIAAIPLIFAITLHEAAHGWIASKFGDKTALMLGRVTLNPVKHIDPFGTIILPVVLLFLGGFIFGWAKPVPVNWQNLKKPRRDMAFVAIAGPGANLVMALFWALIAKLTILYLGAPSAAWLQTVASFLRLTSLFGIMINCVLLIINLIPIPPLDGSRIVSSLLPPAAAINYEKLEPYGIWILLGFLFFVWYVAPQILFGPIRGLIGVIQRLFGL